MVGHNSHAILLLGDMYVKHAAKLKEDVKRMLDKVADPLAGLEMIDDLQRLGVFYHFEDEIKRVLDSIYNNINYYNWSTEDLLNHFIPYSSNVARKLPYDFGSRCNR
ncbi:hypothetical protein HYC85_010699 [Camellia sinensis]|uniref:Terpene synthase N-terminal domain-containing protein n=1 Tax=Camellia sinensis TaxID=4442 RepID=A0A7J7HJK4_CAMSI|nr:hypothetical protein HYC85_010699 [Camellia sinensis]